MTWILLAKYWKETILIGIILALSGALAWTNHTKNNQISNLQRDLATAKLALSTCEQDYLDLTKLNQERNEMIDSLQTELQNRAQALQDALSRPPKIVYRDRIVEVPSIVTEPCEQVWVDVYHYITVVLE